MIFYFLLFPAGGLIGVALGWWGRGADAGKDG